ncbi:MAG TPA: serine/threonine-protein kinase [Polyangiaceae bacterium]|nr:serine/threonine-protein kinase [Polyangiaceae bacterium]
MSVPSGALRAGVLLHNKYRLERVLGSGGMGVVWAAERVTDRERVAVKFLSPGRAHDERTVRRFLREGRATAKLKGEHVARVYDVGALDDHTPYLVMEYLDGVSLLRHLRARGPLPPSEAVGWVLQACEAVAEAHALGIMHRDLKPENLLLVARPDGSRVVKVLDFGLAKRFAGAPASQSGQGVSWSFDTTGDGSPVGSPGYMAPEQISDPSRVDARADIWSLGVILFELLAAQRPFDGASLPETISRVLKSPPPSLPALRPGVPIELVAIVECCLEKDRERRFRNVDALARALSSLRAPETRRTHPPPGGGDAEPGESTLGPLVASRELIYGTQDLDPLRTLPGQYEEPPPSSQMDTIIAATLRDPPRFDDAAAAGGPALPPILGLPAPPGPPEAPPRLDVVPTPPIAIRGERLAQVQETVRLASQRSHPPSGPPATQPIPLPGGPDSEPKITPVPASVPVLILPPPRNSPRGAGAAHKPPGKFDAARTVAIVFVASFVSATLTMTLARKCSTSGDGPSPAASASATAPPPPAPPAR